MDKAEWEHLVKNLKDHLFQLLLLYPAKSDLLELTIITSLHYSTSHYITCKYTYIFVQCLTGHGSLDHTISKQDQFHSKKKTDPRIQSNSKVYCLQEKITLEFFFLNRTHFMSRACFHQVIHLIQSNLHFHTRLSLYIWSNPTYVSTLGCFCAFDQIQPTFSH